MTLSQAFDFCEDKNGKGSTAILALYNNAGETPAEIEVQNHRVMIRLRSADGTRPLAGISTEMESRSIQ